MSPATPPHSPLQWNPGQPQWNSKKIFCRSLENIRLMGRMEQGLRCSHKYSAQAHPVLLDLLHSSLRAAFSTTECAWCFLRDDAIFVFDTETPYAMEIICNSILPAFADQLFCPYTNGVHVLVSSSTCGNHLCSFAGQRSRHTVCTDGIANK